MPIENIDKNIFKIEIPIPKNPLKTLNVYLIKGNSKSLLIDAGINTEEASKLLLESLNKTGIDYSNLDLLLTHMHADHAGLLGLLKKLTKSNANIYISREDGYALNNLKIWEDMLNVMKKHGFPNNLLEDPMFKNPGHMFSHKGEFDYIPVEDNYRINVGGYNLRIVSTPGHTKGHICIYEEKNKLLFSGDHILGDITPNITLGANDFNNPLNYYFNSLKKVSSIEIELVLPGHRKIIKNACRRIKELIDHHNQRFTEIIKILKENKNKQMSFEVASRINWDINYKNWENFPAVQKWFATGEAASHLEYLYSIGKIKREYNNNFIMYYL